MSFSNQAEIAPPLIASDQTDGIAKDNVSSICMNANVETPPSNLLIIFGANYIAILILRGLSIFDKEVKLIRSNLISQVEANRQKSKRLKQLIEERRVTLAQATQLDTQQITDALLMDDKWSEFDEFFQAKGSRRLLFYYQEVSLRVL
ncbi:unnamed protein product [Trichobilharzia regenti]|nr:unnamed protein product [Trichobilharzia regenti]